MTIQVVLLHKIQNVLLCVKKLHNKVHIKHHIQYRANTPLKNHKNHFLGTTTSIDRDEQTQSERRQAHLMGSSLPYILYITLIVQHALLGASTAKQRNDNHHILFLLANVTPTNDFKGALLSCGFEAAAHAAAQVGYQVCCGLVVDGCNARTHHHHPILRSRCSQQMRRPGLTRTHPCFRSRTCPLSMLASSQPNLLRRRPSNRGTQVVPGCSTHHPIR